MRGRNKEMIEHLYAQLTHVSTLLTGITMIPDNSIRWHIVECIRTEASYFADIAAAYAAHPNSTILEKQIQSCYARIVELHMEWERLATVRPANQQAALAEDACFCEECTS